MCTLRTLRFIERCFSTVKLGYKITNNFVNGWLIFLLLCSYLCFLVLSIKSSQGRAKRKIHFKVFGMWHVSLWLTLITYTEVAMDDKFITKVKTRYFAINGNARLVGGKNFFTIIVKKTTRDNRREIPSVIFSFEYRKNWSKIWSSQ